MTKEITSGTDRQNKLVETSKDTAQDSDLSAKKQHLIIWGKSSAEVAKAQTRQALFQETLSRVVASWIQDRVIPLSSSLSEAGIGESLLDEKRRRVNKKWEKLKSIAPPTGEVIHANPHRLDAQDLSAGGLPAVPDNLTHGPTIQTLANDLARGKDIVKRHGEFIVEDLYHRLASEHHAIADATAEKLAAIFDSIESLDDIKTEISRGLYNEDRATTVDEEYRSINTNLELIRTYANRSTGDLQTAINNF